MAVSRGAVTPDRPGSWEHLAVPMPNKARQFSAAEANALTQHAAKTTEMVVSTEQGYKAIREVSRALTSANKNHEVTRRVLASNTLESTQEKVTSAVHLQQLRPAYGQEQRRLDLFAAQAEGAITALG